MHLSQPIPNASSADPARWQAVSTRDKAADGQFWYGVRSTGVYCRPHCPSRPAKRENVTFHATRADAVAAGYRPCKRCRPDRDGAETVEALAVAKACRLIATAEEMPSLSTLASAVGVSAFHFHRLFKAVTGVTPKRYAMAQRAQRVSDALARNVPVTAAIYDAGFNASSRFYETAKVRLGMTPTTYRKGGAGEAIRYSIVPCSLGLLLVAATEKGLCSIRFGNTEAELRDELTSRFPQAEIDISDRAFQETVAATVAYVEHPRDRFGLPLDIQGTAFQQRVWQALQDIPLGQTASYRDIANAIGQPAAVRAVAGACAANAVAVAIPCHRVVKSDGALSGYRWGVERKRKLLQRERAR